MRIVFIGSGDFARDLLNSLIAGGLRVEAVIVPPEHPSGRGLRLKASALKVLAEESGLTVLQPGDARESGFADSLRELEPDLALVSDFGYILPGPVLAIPPKGCLNVHPSLLPLYRGAAPIQRALMDGVDETGVTLMLLDEGMDTGPILYQSVMVVEEGDDAGTLRERLASLAARMLLEEMPRYLSGEAVPRPQDDRRATYAPPLSKDELEIDWSRPAKDIHNLVRALAPRPGAYCTLRGKRIKVLRTVLVYGYEKLAASELMVVDKSTLIAGSGGGALALDLLQPEGRKPMSAGEFMRGYRLHPGERFDNAGVSGTAG